MTASTEFLIIGLKQLPMHVPGVTSVSVIETFQQYHLIEILEQCWMTSQTWRTICKALYVHLCNIAQTYRLSLSNDSIAFLHITENMIPYPTIVLDGKT